MKRFLLFAVCVAVLGSIIFMQSQQKYIRVGTTSFTVEVARTPAAIEQGLSDRDELGSDGMLFVLPSKTVPAFWMKGMRFPLDFVWIDTNVVVDITEHVLHPTSNAQYNDLPLYRPKQEVTHVLELPVGTIQQHQLKIGDTAQFGVK